MSFFGIEHKIEEYSDHGGWGKVRILVLTLVCVQWHPVIESVTQVFHTD